jgi:hypothetical protein
MAEGGVLADQSTIYFWFEKYVRLKSGYAGIGAGINRRVGVSMRPM